MDKKQILRRAGGSYRTAEMALKHTDLNSGLCACGAPATWFVKYEPGSNVIACARCSDRIMKKRPELVFHPLTRSQTELQLLDFKEGG
jgi:hypothetical protein